MFKKVMAALLAAGVTQFAVSAAEVKPAEKKADAVKICEKTGKPCTGDHKKKGVDCKEEAKKHDCKKGGEKSGCKKEAKKHDCKKGGKGHDCKKEAKAAPAAK